MSQARGTRGCWMVPFSQEVNKFEVMKRYRSIEQFGGVFMYETKRFQQRLVILHALWLRLKVVFSSCSASYVEKQSPGIPKALIYRRNWKKISHKNLKLWCMLTKNCGRNWWYIPVYVESCSIGCTNMLNETSSRMWRLTFKQCRGKQNIQGRTQYTIGCG